MKNYLYEYLKTNRGVGHTRLLIDGARNANYPFLVVGADTTQANRMIQDLGNEFAIPTAINKEQDYRGHDHPVLIDNFAFTSTCESYIRQIRDQREALEKTEAKTAKLELAFNKMNNLPLWIRMIKPLYKRAIKRAYEDK